MQHQSTCASSTCAARQQQRRSLSTLVCTAATRSVTLLEGTYNIDGFRSNYVVAKPQQSTAELDTESTGREPIVLIHGFGSNKAHFSQNLEALAGSTGRAVYAIDLLGHGQSAKPQGVSYDCSLWDWQVQTLVQDVIGEKVFLVGHSLGGPPFLASLARACGSGLVCISFLKMQFLPHIHSFLHLFSRALLPPLPSKHTYTPMHTHAHIHTHTHMPTRPRARIHTHEHTNARTHTISLSLSPSLSLFLSLSLSHAHARAHTHTHIHIHIHTHTHTHTHTHIRTLRKTRSKPWARYLCDTHTHTHTHTCTHSFRRTKLKSWDLRTYV